jgi:membrane-associated phospholipid phosphatase
MKPIFLASADALKFAAPPQVGTSAFDKALAEVRQRATPSNTAGFARAKRWEMVTGPLVAGYWDATAAELSRRSGLSGAETARVLALTMGAGMDANIVCHRAKYTHWTPRPSQADPAIKPLLGLPNHPSYPSNHSCDSMAAATVLGALFPRHKALLDAMAREAGESRIDGGLHYRFDVEAGEGIGRGAAAAALRAAESSVVAEQRP